MQLIADTHLHFYPCYDIATAMRSLVANLGALAPCAVKAGLLAERWDCRFFADLRDGRVRLTDGFNVKPTAEPEALLCENGDAELYLLAGRQIVTAERIEILALTRDAQIEDGRSAEDVVKSVLDAGGIPVLSWAPGKWFFKRGEVARDLVRKFKSDQILIGDTSLRPILWGEPFLMREAAANGYRVVAGSDPLPFAGEERKMGTYASLLDGPFDSAMPASSIRGLLTNPETMIQALGKRSNVLEVIGRLRRNAAAKNG